MKEVENPPRLFEAGEAPIELRTWLRQAQQDVPSPAETERLIRSVETCAALSATPPAGFRRARGRGTTKILAGLAVIGIGLGGYVASRSRQVAPAMAPAAPEPAQPAIVAAPSPEPTPAAPSPAINEAPASPVARRAPRIAHTQAKDRDTVLRTSVATQSSGTDSTQADEFALLRAARQAIADRPERALALTEEHARKFPAGMLAQEREAIAVEALVKLGRGAQAQARAQRFLAAHPDSPYKSRIDAALTRISGTPRAP